MADDNSTQQTPAPPQPDPNASFSKATGLSAGPQPGILDRVWGAIKEGIPLFNDKFAAAAGTDTGTLATGETPKMQIVTPEAAMTETERKAHPIATGIAETAGGLTSPGSVAGIAATGGFGELPGAAKTIIPRLASLGFTEEALRGAYNQIPSFKKAMDAGDASEAERIATHIVLDTAVGAYAGQHAVAGAGEAVHEAGAAARENMAARHEASLQDARTGKVVDMPGAPKQLTEGPKALPAAPEPVKPHITFEEAGGAEVAPPHDAETSVRIADLKRMVDSPNSIESKNAQALLKESYGIDAKPGVGATVNPEDASRPLGPVEHGLSDAERAMRIEDLQQLAKSTNPREASAAQKILQIHYGVGEDGEPTGEAGAIEPQFKNALASRNQMPDQTVSLSPAGSTYVGHQLEARNALAEPSLHQAYTDAVGTTTGSDLLPVPKRMLDPGQTPEAGIAHEVFHALELDRVGAKWGTGIENHPIDIMSHFNSALDGATMGITMPWEKVPGAELQPNGFYNFKGPALREIVPDLLSILMAGGTGANLSHETPAEAGMVGDNRDASKLMRAAGFTPDEAKDLTAKTKENLRQQWNNPDILNLVRGAAAGREEGLSKTLHMSSERLQNIRNRVRQIRQEAPSGQETSNTPASAGAGSAVSATAGQPGRAGLSTEGNLREGNGEAVSPVAESRKVAPLPPQPKLPETGQYAAVQTDDGGIYPDMQPEKQRTHIMLAQDLGIPPERVTGGGWLKNGVYEDAGYRSDAGRWGEQARAKIQATANRVSRTVKTAPATEYHPDLQKVIDQHRLTGAPPNIGFIAPDGKFVDLGSEEHPAAIARATGATYARDAVEDKLSGQPATVSDNRINFIDQTGAARIRFRTGRGGNEVVISVPSKGVTPEQIPAIQQAIAKVGRNGNLVMERADVSPETKDRLTMTKEFPRAADTEKYLKQIEAYPGAGTVSVRPNLETRATPALQQHVDDSQWVEEPKTGYQRLEVRGEHGAPIGELEYAGGVGDETSRIRKSFIEPEYRNQGVAKEMYKSYINNALQQGIKTIQSDTVVSNDARNVWESLIRDGYPIQRVYTKNFNANGGGGVEYHLDADATKKFLAGKDTATSLREMGNEYNAAQGRPAVNPAHVEEDPRASEIADAYKAAVHAPDDPAVKASYDALKRDIDQQYELAQRAGIKMDVQPENPYGLSTDVPAHEELHNDVLNNKHLSVWSGGAPPADHPLSAVDPKTGLTYNDKFRMVHDIFGHAVERTDFTPAGEESAWNLHRQMFSPEARPALATETRGQAAYTFKYGDFPPQKATILPEHLQVRPEDWHELASNRAATEPAGGIDPRTGKTDTAGIGTEIYPEKRQPINHAPTSADFQKFYEQHKAIFDKNPELRVGWDNESSAPGGHEINIGAVGPGAVKVAGRLDQRNAYDIAKGANIDAGGTGKQTQFPDYSLEDRLKDLRTEPESFEPGKVLQSSPGSGDRVSSRFPTAVRATEDPMKHDLTLSVDDLYKQPAVAQRIADKIVKQNKSMVFTPEDLKSPKGIFDKFMQYAEDNQVATYEHARDRGDNRHITNRVWYDGAHEFGAADAKRENLQPRQTWAVTATQSPQKDWNQNISLYERILDTVQHKSDVPFTPEMTAKGKEFVASIAQNNAKRVAQGKHPVTPWVDKALIKALQGKSLADLSDPTQQAAWVRLYDEAHNPREFRDVNADGTKGDVVKTAAGEPEHVAWGGLSSIAKAISILHDGSLENISKQLGQNHKVRSFYNNIAEPNSPHGDVTADTHHVGLSLMRPVAGDDPETKLNFGENGSSITGTYGTYPLYVEATRRAVQRINDMHPNDPPIEFPRQLQSVDWVEWRQIFPPDSRTAETKSVVDSIWKEHLDGKITADQARKQVFDYAAKLNSGVYEGAQHPSDQAELFGRGVHGTGTTLGSGSGNSTRTTGGREVGEAAEPDEGDTSFNFGANVKSQKLKRGISGLGKK